MGGRNGIRTGRQVHRIPRLRNRFGTDRQCVLSKLALRDALSQGFRTEFFIKTGLVLLGASINLKVLVTAAGPAIIQALLLIIHRVRLHLVAGRSPQARGQAARAAGVGRVDLRRERGHRRRRCGAGQKRTTRLRRVPGDRLRAAVDLPTAMARRRSQPFRRRRRCVDRRQHRHHRGRRRLGRDRGRGRPADRHHCEDHPERVDRSRRDRVDRVLRVESGAQVRRRGPAVRSGSSGNGSRNSCWASSPRRSSARCICSG